MPIWKCTVCNVFVCAHFYCYFSTSFMRSLACPSLSLSISLTSQCYVCQNRVEVKWWAAAYNCIHRMCSTKRIKSHLNTQIEWSNDSHPIQFVSVCAFIFPVQHKIHSHTHTHSEQASKQKILYRLRDWPKTVQIESCHWRKSSNSYIHRDIFRVTFNAQNVHFSALV